MNIFVCTHNILIRSLNLLQCLLTIISTLHFLNYAFTSISLRFHFNLCNTLTPKQFCIYFTKQSGSFWIPNFVTLHHPQVTDPEILELLFTEARCNVMDGTYPCDRSLVVSLAGILCAMQYGPYNEEEHTPDFYK